MWRQLCRSPRGCEPSQHWVSPRGSYASRATAARIWGGIVPEIPDVHVTVPATAGRSSRQGVKAHAGINGAAVTRFRNLPISTPEQIFLDLATSLDLVALVVLGDSSSRQAGQALLLFGMPHSSDAAVVQSRLAAQRGTFATASTPRWRRAFACCSCWPVFQYRK
jgi:hypothetical protein